VLETSSSLLASLKLKIKTKMATVRKLTVEAVAAPTVPILGIRIKFKTIFMGMTMLQI
jgi:hypothetical protein